MQPITIQAPAKLTLSLRITGVRPDGYHLIDAELVSLALADTLTIDPTGTGLSADGPFSVGMPLDDTNLVAKALTASGRTARVHIHKAIPHGGGLGGGSADAAAVLRWARFADLVAASRIGADIPFCMIGGRARVQGIGEVIEPLSFRKFDLTLIIPPLSVSTPAAYRAWDELAAAHPDDAHKSINELEAAALAVEPRLGAWRDRIAEASGQIPTLAGSGATWFLLGRHPQLAAAFADAHVVLTHTAPA